MFLLYYTYISMSSKILKGIKNFVKKRPLTHQRKRPFLHIMYQAFECQCIISCTAFSKLPHRAESLLILFTFGKILFAKIPLIKDICFVFPVTIAPLNDHEASTP